MISHYNFDPGFGSINLSQYKEICIPALFVVIGLILFIGIIYFFVVIKNTKRNIIIYIKTSNDVNNLHYCHAKAVKQTAVLSKFYPNIHYKVFNCVFCAYQYIVKNHDSILLIHIDSWLTSCLRKKPIHKHENDNFLGEHGGDNFYKDIIASQNISISNIAILLRGYNENTSYDIIPNYRKNDRLVDAGFSYEKFLNLINELLSQE